MASLRVAVTAAVCVLGVMFVPGCHCQSYCDADQDYVAVSSTCCQNAFYVNNIFYPSMHLGVCCRNLNGTPCSCMTDHLPSDCTPLCQSDVACPQYATCQTGACVCSVSASAPVNGICPTPTTTPQPTTTTITTPLPTTTPTPTVCPGPSARILNAEAIPQSCYTRGVLGLGFISNGAFLSLCNAVYAYNSVTATSEIFIAEECRQGMEDIAQFAPLRYIIQGTDYTFSFNYVNTINTRGNVSRLSLFSASPMRTQLGLVVPSSQCSGASACLLTNSLHQFINTSSCYLYSHGPYTSGGLDQTNELRRAKVVFVEKSLCGIELADYATTQCVVLEGNSSVCRRDSSAPLFCSLTTGEEAALGVSEIINTCDGEQFVKVYTGGIYEETDECPNADGRLSDSTDVSNLCEFHGSIGIGFAVPTFGTYPNTNGIFIYNSTTQTKQIVMTAENWQQLVDSEDALTPYRFLIQDHEGSFSTSMITSVTTVSTQLVSLTPSAALLSQVSSWSSECLSNTACLFTRSMEPSRQRSQCFLLSYGENDVTGDPRAKLRKVMVDRVEDKSRCGVYPNQPYYRSALCVRLRGSATTQRGDSSSGLYCHLSSGETTLLGVSERVIFTTPQSYVTIFTSGISTP